MGTKPLVDEHFIFNEVFKAQYNKLAYWEYTYIDSFYFLFLLYFNKTLRLGCFNFSNAWVQYLRIQEI